jgi:Domain of unknown function (DUF4157)
MGARSAKERPLRVGGANDPLEHDARHANGRWGGSEASAPGRYGLRAVSPAGGSRVAHSGASDAPAVVLDGLLQMRGGGQPLPADERRAFGRRFGHDFSQVRVHTGSQAARATAALHARAFALASMSS